MVQRVLQASHDFALASLTVGPGFVDQCEHQSGSGYEPTCDVGDDLVRKRRERLRVWVKHRRRTQTGAVEDEHVGCAIVGDLPEPEVISSVAMRYWVFSYAAQQRAKTLGDVRDEKLLGGALEAGAARLRRFYEGLSDRLRQPSDPDGEPEDALDPEALDIVDRLHDHLARRLGWLVAGPGERLLDPYEDMAHVAAFYESDEPEDRGDPEADR
ncbi:hypothetical protein HC251_14175 [Iamia sp. SCSIO 61187]|uniref:hypothetical protein n=1 Tax=Iamia sp. SCSIO 61187 TaxID=2722752 RepID=UPI001C62921C|nr:hypothetical protein [Iamia sp. SCSIO 61187]QYG93455.1 hypothetical protein HC251_14175 [Iamia sp. SCSIO 61187]